MCLSLLKLNLLNELQCSGLSFRVSPFGPLTAAKISATKVLENSYLWSVLSNGRVFPELKSPHQKWRSQGKIDLNVHEQFAKLWFHSMCVCRSFVCLYLAEGSFCSLNPWVYSKYPMTSVTRLGDFYRFCNSRSWQHWFWLVVWIFSTNRYVQNHHSVNLCWKFSLPSGSSPGVL